MKERKKIERGRKEKEKRGKKRGRKK